MPIVDLSRSLHPCLVIALSLLSLPRASAAQQAPAEDPFDRIEWTEPGETVAIGNIAKLTVPAQCRFTGTKGSMLFDESNQNIPSDETLGTLLCDINPPDNPEARYWYAQFYFSADGYIKDAASEKLDTDAILKTVKEATEYANEEREKRGWGKVEVLGWGKVLSPVSSHGTCSAPMPGSAGHGPMYMMWRMPRTPCRLR